MKTLQYKCTLLSDVILNVKSASEGPNETLDFIPGNNFLGIAAKELYEDGSPESLYIFHSGHVRFGDAHPCAEKDNIRTLRTPAAMYYPKLMKETDGEVYINYLIPDLESDDILKKQLKQCRSGFYAFSGNEGIRLNATSLLPSNQHTTGKIADLKILRCMDTSPLKKACPSCLK